MSVIPVTRLTQSTSCSAARDVSAHLPQARSVLVR
jgi:hypothetical protein